jgi:hypothetical protein
LLSIKTIKEIEEGDKKGCFLREKLNMVFTELVTDKLKKDTIQNQMIYFSDLSSSGKN